MNGILSELSIFHKVATKEDDYTQILCNLMKRQEGKELRTSVLSMILGNSDLASQVSPDQIDTQVSMREAGRPDLIVESPVVYAVIEVKLNPRRGLTAYQFGGYSIFFASATAPRKVLAFLVPANWQYQQLLDKDLEVFKKDNPSICTKVVQWEEIYRFHKQLFPDRIHADPIQVEFWRLLRHEFGGVEFSTEEIDMMVNGKGLQFTAFNKAAHVVDEIAEKCNKEEFIIAGPTHNVLSDEYGIYFYRSKSDKARGRNHFFWFGIWSLYWEKRGRALCFGITNDKKAELDAFKNSYSKTDEFCDGSPELASSVYTLGWIEDELSASRNDSIPRIWESLKPILYKVYEAGG
jgi:hypothetical protein